MRTGTCSGSSQLVVQAVYIHTHHTARNSSVTCTRFVERELCQQRVRQLRDREHEHEVEEQLDHADAPAARTVSIAQQCTHCSLPVRVYGVPRR